MVITILIIFLIFTILFFFFLLLYIFRLYILKRINLLFLFFEKIKKDFLIVILILYFLFVFWFYFFYHKILYNILDSFVYLLYARNIDSDCRKYVLLEIISGLVSTFCFIICSFFISFTISFFFEDENKKAIKTIVSFIKGILTAFFIVILLESFGLFLLWLFFL